MVSISIFTNVLVFLIFKKYHLIFDNRHTGVILFLFYWYICAKLNISSLHIKKKCILIREVPGLQHCLFLYLSFIFLLFIELIEFNYQNFSVRAIARHCSKSFIYFNLLKPHNKLLRYVLLLLLSYN